MLVEVFFPSLSLSPLTVLNCVNKLVVPVTRKIQIIPKRTPLVRAHARLLS